MATSPLSLAQFGQRIKAKHPEYADMEDADLGKRVLAKYPEYGDMVAPDVPKAPQVDMQKVDTPKAGGIMDTLGNVGSHLKNMVAGPYHAFTDAPQPGAEQGIANSQVGQMGLGIYRMLAKPSVDAAGTAVDQAKKGNLYSNDEYDASGNYKPSAFSSAVDAIPVAGPWARNIETEAHQKGMVPALAGLATDLAPTALPTMLPPVGRAMQSGGEGLINKTVGALKNDYARGANPGKGYFQAGLGPSASMDSIAAKASGALDKTGQQLGSLYDDATTQGKKIPAQDVMSAINPPINETRNVVMGPGGTMDSAPIDQFENSFKPSIQAAQNAGGFSPRDLFGIKKNVSKNTNWSDPTQVGMKQLRQQTTGAIGGVLTDNVPGTAPLNSQYQNLMHLADRAETRALTGSSPLTHLMTKTALGAGGAALGFAHSPMAAALGAGAAMAADSIPARTSLASALYYGGKGAVAVGNGIKGLYAAPAVLPHRKPY